MSIQSTLASNMKKYRKRIGLSQEALAEKCGLHRTYIGGIEQERVNVSVKNIERIATALGVDPALLFVFENNAFDPEAAAVTRGGNGNGKRGKRSQKAAPKGSASATPGNGVKPVKFDTSGVRSESYALCILENGGLRLEPIEVDDPDITVQILSSLIQEGYEGDELAKRYRETKKEIVAQLHHRSPESPLTTSE